MQIILRCIITDQNSVAIPGSAMVCAGLTFLRRSPTVFESRVDCPADCPVVAISGLTATAPGFKTLIQNALASVDAICRVYFKLLP